MLIRKIMKQTVVSAPTSATVLEAARLMIWKHVGTLPIVDDNRRLVGGVKISDILDIFIPNYFDLMENLIISQKVV